MIALPPLVDVQHELLGALSRSNSLDETLEHCYNAAIRLSGLDCGGIYLTRGDGSMELRFHRNLGDEFVSINGVVPANDPRAELVRSGRSLYTSLAEVRSQTLRDDDSDDELTEGLKALAVVPILFDEQAVGCMNLASHRLNAVPEDRRRVLEVLGRQIGQSISREMVHAALREREENLDTFFNNVGDLLFVLDEEARILRVNRAAADVLGVTPDSLVGRPAETLHPPDRRDEARDALRSAREDRATMHGAPLLGADGRSVPAETRITRGTWNAAPAFYLVARDMTAASEAEAERRDLETRLQQSQRLESLGVLAGGIAHDFNNILVSVLGNASVALNEAGASDRSVPYLNRIIAGAERAATLCRQMLAYSGRGRFVTETLDLNDQVEEVSALVRASRDPARVELHLDGQSLPFDADAAQASQVILNLVLNAIEASEANTSVHVRTGLTTLGAGALPDAVLRAPRPGRFVVLEVEDHGHGMSPAVMEHLFDPFFTTKPTGHGLGMSAVLGIVKGHSGALVVESEERRGTTFRVYFPAAEAAPETVAPPPSTDETEARILLIDDDPTVLDIVGQLLESAGHAVTSMTSGEEAVAAFESGNDGFELVLLDLTMPELSGASTLGMLSDLNPDVPVVLMSGYGADEVRGHESSNLAGFLGKPFTRDRLLATVREHARERAPTA